MAADLALLLRVHFRGEQEGLSQRIRLERPKFDQINKDPIRVDLRVS